MRDAIDRYKDYADRGAFQIKADTNGYPPTLKDLVKGVDVQGRKREFAETGKRRTGSNGGWARRKGGHCPPFESAPTPAS
jgi:hypothetical protein